MNIRYPIYEGVYRILTFLFEKEEEKEEKTTKIISIWRII